MLKPWTKANSPKPVRKQAAIPNLRIQKRKRSSRSTFLDSCSRGNIQRLSAHLRLPERFRSRSSVPWDAQTGEISCLLCGVCSSICGRKGSSRSCKRGRLSLRLLPLLTFEGPSEQGLFHPMNEGYREGLEAALDRNDLIVLKEYARD